jgi:hypothetical protein
MRGFCFADWNWMVCFIGEDTKAYEEVGVVKRRYIIELTDTEAKMARIIVSAGLLEVIENRIFWSKKSRFLKVCNKLLALFEVVKK